MKIKEKIVKLFIPKNTPYCHHNFKKNKKHGVCAKPCMFWCYKYNEECKCEMEYCKYLKKFLLIQDQIKDCGLNDYYDQ